MSLTSGDLPYVSIAGVGTDPEQRVSVEFTFRDDTGTVDEQDVVDAIQQVLLNASGVASTSAIKYTLTQTQL